MIEEVKTIADKCNINKKIEPAVGDAVKAAGIGFLLASNCTKDIGILLLIADEIIQDPTDIVGDIFILIFVYILGRQSFHDCAQFIHYIIWLGIDHL